MKHKLYFCWKCGWQFPVTHDIISMQIHTTNKCFNCGAKVWENGKFLGEVRHDE
jgi:DNA-directed RNA polymerase subunit RPC12/RpoP